MLIRRYILLCLSMGLLSVQAAWSAESERKSLSAVQNGQASRRAEGSAGVSAILVDVPKRELSQEEMAKLLKGIAGVLQYSIQEKGALQHEQILQLMDCVYKMIGD